jgi:hypothetical protein
MSSDTSYFHVEAKLNGDEYSFWAGGGGRERERETVGDAT